jgi:hypothetical protein
MPHEVKLHPDHAHKSMEQRVRDRLKPSNNLEEARFHAHTGGDSPQRVHTTGHDGNVRQRGEGDKGQGDISGGSRTAAHPTLPPGSRSILGE